MRPRKDFFLSPSTSFESFIGISMIVICLAMAGCDSAPLIESVGLDTSLPRARVEPLPDDQPSKPYIRPRPVRIATFNIQVFGKTKMAIPHVVDVLSDIVRKFDIVAIQEIRSLDQNLMPNFLKHINQHGAKYDFVIGPRLGRSRSKEQYAYVFNTETIQLFWPSVYTMPDEADEFHREPLIASFQTITNGQGPPFRFTMMNVHVDPHEVSQEIGKLDDAFRATQAAVGGEDDVILAGDLNADPRDYQELGRLNNIAWAVVGIPTNTRGTRGYDNLLFDRVATTEYLGRSGVIDLQAHYNLTQEQALDVSDHLPVWAEFYPYEVGPDLDLAAPQTPSLRQ